MTNIFHRFIERSASKPKQCDRIREFGYMEQQIRKAYGQLKEKKSHKKPCDQFIAYWKQIGKDRKDELIRMYVSWVVSVQITVKGESFGSLPDVSGEVFIKKSILSKWQIRKITLSGLNMLIFSKKIKQIPLRYYEIRKSKNKDHFSWVMQVVRKSSYRSFHVGTNNSKAFQQWFREVEKRIERARVQYFQQKLEQNGLKTQQAETQLQEHLKQGFNTAEKKSNSKNKTLTELVMDKQMKKLEDDELEIIEQTQKFSSQEIQIHPNIFKKLFPHLQMNEVATNDSKGTLLHSQKNYKIYEIEKEKKIHIKMIVKLKFNRSLVFRAISESHKQWNSEIGVFGVKNRVSSENSYLIYQKDKAQGFLYRQRDFLFLRHCFSLQDKNSKEKSFMIEKSIDSLNNPPFMSVIRGYKELIWCVIGTKEQEQCDLVVEGLIQGGGYMNSGDDKQMTAKNMKKTLNLQSYLKTVDVKKQDNLLFKQKWLVDLKEPAEDEFYSPKSFQKEQKDCIKEDDDDKYEEFIKNTSLCNVSEGVNEPRNSEEGIQTYEAPKFREDQSIIIPHQYLRKTHILCPKVKGKPKFFPHFRGHHLFKGQWIICPTGGLNYVDEVKMNQQRKVLSFIIRSIGRNILSGKGILNISLPVDIFCRESNIERIAMSFGYYPAFLEKAASLQDPVQQLKLLVASSIGGSLIYLTMEKPFNPILGETYQCWIDGCPVYFEQISHHPPIAAYFMKGRGFTVSGTVEAKMDLSINSGTGVNEGIFTVKFDSGQTFYFTTPPGQLSGLTYGQRKLIFTEKIYFWNMEEGLFLELAYNIISKVKGFFGMGGKNLVGDQRLNDYFQGTLRKYSKEELQIHLTPKKNDFRKLMAIPKSVPAFEPQKQHFKVYGRWNKYVMAGSQKIFDAENDRYYRTSDEKYPLPSHCNFRQDVVYRRLNNFVVSQSFKEVLQIKQRKDKKLREECNKKKK